MISKLLVVSLLATLESRSVKKAFMVVDEEEYFADLEYQAAMDRERIKKAKEKHRRRYLKRLALEKAGVKE